VAGERNGWFTLFRRTPGGTLTNVGRLQANGHDIQTNNNSWPCVVDWNRDGRKDLLVGQEGVGAPCNVFYYPNAGLDSNPVFGDSFPVLVSGQAIRSYRCVPLLEDLDRDGRRDLVLGEWYSSVRLYSNTGTDSNPAFTSYVNLVLPDPVGFVNGNPPRVNLVDWDGDADLDMVTCDYYGSVFLRRNVTPTAVADVPAGAGRIDNCVTIVRGMLRLAGAETAELLDAGGRRVLSLRPGENDVSRLSPGVYFLRAGSRVQGSEGPSRKVVVAR
jgi:hypothetical protein